jgi:hypothetical protein
MNHTSSRRSPLRPALGSGLILAGLGLAGCTQPGEVQDLPQTARESLARKKVDVQPRTVPSPPKGAATGRRP